jgi:glyoxylase-like metal-dependent hydrolase (beta-lactamase superfamily II)
MIYGYEGKEVLEFPLIAWYLEGERRILVDTGGSPPESAAGKKAMPYQRAPEQEIDKALGAIGVSPDDIECVILTHLHWDHAGNNHFFPHAKLICQMSELGGLSDEENAGKGYDLDYISGFYYTLTDGDEELFDGISVMLTPGHTPGMQCVIVDTEDGKAILTGDLITLRESLGFDPPRFNALLYSDGAFAQAQESLNKALAISRLIYPGHDYEVFK